MPARDAQGAPCPSSGGDGYCDANDVGGSWCFEMDVMEANTAAVAVTPHTCSAPNAAGQYEKCDKGGCSANSRKAAPPNSFGPGSAFTIDTLQPFRVATSWIASGGNLTRIVSEFSQGAASTFSMTHTDALCGSGYLSNMSTALAAGMVPALSVWGDTESGSDMTWCVGAAARAASAVSASLAGRSVALIPFPCLPPTAGLTRHRAPHHKVAAEQAWRPLSRCSPSKIFDRYTATKSHPGRRGTCVESRCHGGASTFAV